MCERSASHAFRFTPGGSAHGNRLIRDPYAVWRETRSRAPSENLTISPRSPAGTPVATRTELTWLPTAITSVFKWPVHGSRWTLNDKCHNTVADRHHPHWNYCLAYINTLSDRLPPSLSGWCSPLGGPKHFWNFAINTKFVSSNIWRQLCATVYMKGETTYL